MEVDQQRQDDYDAKFEFDAPRYYDFDSMTVGTPGDKWFDTAPDGPGCKADKGRLVMWQLICSRDPGALVTVVLIMHCRCGCCF